MKEFSQSLEEIAAKISSYRLAKGFLPATWDTAVHRLACIASEIWELEEELAETTFEKDPQGFLVRHEFVDVVLYILGLQLDLGFTLGTARTKYYQMSGNYKTAADWTAPLRREWDQAFRCWRENNKKDFPVSLEILLVATLELRSQIFSHNDGLFDDCLAKLENLADRPHLHGGKNPLT